MFSVYTITHVICNYKDYYIVGFFFYYYYYYFSNCWGVVLYTFILMNKYREQNV
jgi:hypothetical protein